MRHFIAMLATLALVSCIDDNANGVPDSQVLTPDATAQQKCDIGTADYGFCPREFKYQGAFEVAGVSGWQCSCTTEEMEEFGDSGEAPGCCTWKDSQPYGYMYITPKSEYDGTIVLHTEAGQAPYAGSILFGKYQQLTYEEGLFMDRAQVMLRSYAGGQETLSAPYRLRHYLIMPDLQAGTLTLSFSIAYPQPIFDEHSDGYRLDFVVTLKRVGGATDCFHDVPERGLRFGHCHSGPVCHRLVAGCVPESVCSALTNGMTFFYSSWNPPGTNACNVRYYDQFYSSVLNSYM